MRASLRQHKTSLGLHPHADERPAKSKWRDEPDYVLLQLYANQKHTWLWQNDAAHTKLATRLHKSNLCHKKRFHQSDLQPK